MRYLWMKQKGEGCDYTVGCGQVLQEMEGKSVEYWLDYYGISEDYRALADACVLEFAEDAFPQVLRRYARLKKEAEIERQVEKEATFERLKKELGK